MKKLIALILALMLLFSLTACGEKDNESRKLFDYKDLGKYIDIAKYEGIEISKSDEKIVDAVSAANKSNLDSLSLGEEVEVASGTVEKGDNAHIKYVGKIDGVAFEGGSTGDEGADLVIGSNSYIDGFESGLIGAAIGSKKVLNLKFPKDYHQKDYAGKDVEFTVYIEYVKRTRYPELTDDIAKQLGYDILMEYNAEVLKNCIKTELVERIAKDSKVIKQPEKELDYYVENDVEYYKSYAQSMGYTFEDYLKNYSMDEKAFREQIRANYEDTMVYYLVVYYIAREENLTATKDEMTKEYEKLAKEYSMEVSAIKEQMPEEQMEFTIIYEKVQNFIYDNAKIK